MHIVSLLFWIFALMLAIRLFFVLLEVSIGEVFLFCFSCCLQWACIDDSTLSVQGPVNDLDWQRSNFCILQPHATSPFYLFSIWRLLSVFSPTLNAVSGTHQMRSTFLLTRVLREWMQEWKYFVCTGKSVNSAWSSYCNLYNNDHVMFCMMFWNDLSGQCIFTGSGFG